MVDVNMPNTLLVNGKEYKIIGLLGKGKGGYSYLASDGEQQYVLKQIHHEPCSYYQFGNKIQAEINDYNRLKKIGIRIPEMIDVDIVNERILKEYIEGRTIYELVKSDCMKNEYIEQIKDMCSLLYPANTNIDYFPTNFVVQNRLIYYIDLVLVSKWVGKVIWPVNQILLRPCCYGNNRCLSPSEPHLSAV